MSTSLPAVNSVWFGAELKKFRVVKVLNGNIHYRPYVNAFKDGSPEYFTTLEAFKERFSPFTPKKYSAV